MGYGLWVISPVLKCFLMHMSNVLFITDTKPDIPPDVLLGLGLGLGLGFRAKVRV